ncbi:probable L-type lectin-domain containing receptor kinase S.5 [Ziziphus jujuba]|uniref:Probable L-type lectin-domain containing receptor kinase S.5 n=1 Tax=Ziziphus jujuba TaxID=326968 RepID=A0A6P4A7E7_ZIZJJ|nr:probable L-type lectin-domain containing receptor kinase S.5 [Ziziphus jujuba]
MKTVSQTTNQEAEECSSFEPNASNNKLKPVGDGLQLELTMILLVMLLLFPAAAISDVVSQSHNKFGPFDESYYSTFAVKKPATISNFALQVTPDSAGDFSLSNRSGRVLFNQSFVLWTSDSDSQQAGMEGKVASFNTSFLINVHRMNSFLPHGEGLAFIIAPDLELPTGSHGQYLGLTNSTTDGNPSNHLVAIELDTFKQDFDPDDNHLGLNINSVRSVQNVSLSQFDIQIAPSGTRYHMVWIQYDGNRKLLDVYMAEQAQELDESFVIMARPSKPLLSANLTLKDIVKQKSYFGFAASTGNATQLNCVLRWNLTVDALSVKENGTGERRGLKIALWVGLPSSALVLLGLAGLAYYIHKKRKAASDPNILGALKSLPGTPREFGFSELKKATNNFDDKQKLGEGGFGVVYRGILPKENLEVAVKKFSRDDLKGKDEFLAELTIINRLRHKHLVRLLGWCHKNGTLLLVYEYMPNGSLDNHLFCGSSEHTTLGWSLRYKIVSGVASALHYLHNEYDQKVVHRDLKASNIMLDSNFNARLGDFGLARALENGKTSYAEMGGIQGTMGYIAPECFHTGKATRESDVFGFGAVLLEVVCGQRPWTKRDSFQYLVDWVWCLHREGRIVAAVDERLGNNYVVEEAERLLLLGLACSHPNASERPKMQAIVQIISGSIAVPHVPPFKPAFVWPSLPEEFGMDSLATTTTATSMQVGSGSNSAWTRNYDSQDSNLGEGYSDSHTF